MVLLQMISRLSGLSPMLGVVLVAAVIFAVIGGAIIYYNANPPGGSPNTSLARFAVESLRVTAPNGSAVLSGLVYVASTPAQQAQGFQNATSFGNCNGRSDNSLTRCVGMIFSSATTQNLCFWMHDTPMPLQQVWISSGGMVAAVYQAQPDSDKSMCFTARYVLETSPSAQISLGDAAYQGSP